MNKEILIKKIRKLRKPVKCNYMGLDGHHPGCVIMETLENSVGYNLGLKDVAKLIRKGA